MKPIPLLFLSLSIGTSAMADSFCNYEEGYIGTKAIGVISPFALNFHTHEQDTTDCFVTVQPDSNKYDRYTAFDLPCHNIEPLPSEYIDTPETQPDGHNPAGNEYFAYMVFSEVSGLLELRLVNGTSVYVDSPKGYISTHSARNAVGKYGLTTSDAFYSSPRIEAQTDAPNYDGKIQQNFLTLMVDDPAFNPKQINAYLADNDARNQFGLWLIDFSYTVTDTVIGTGGRQWYKTEERIKLDVQGQAYPRLREAYGHIEHPASDVSIVSDVLRTVYLPFRDLEGRIESVFLPGPYCD